MYRTKRACLLRLLTWVALLFGMVLVVWLSLNFLLLKFSTPSGDFIEYWSAGQLLLEGANPYDPEALLLLQRAIGREEPRPLLMYNPPWVLPMILLFALLPYSVGRFLWFSFHSVVLLLCASLIWRLYGGVWKRVWISWVLIFTFFPTFELLLAGQIGAFILLGVVLFLYFEHRGMGVAAGISTLFVAVKPQVCYLFWFVLLLWCFRYKKWSVLLSCFLVFLAALAISLVFNPQVFNQYLYMVVNHPPVEWITPTLGAALRLLWGAEKFGLQFVSVVLGGGWLVYRWYHHRLDWNWKEEMPGLLFVSILTSPYVWTHDYIVVILPVIYAFIIVRSGLQQVSRRFLISYMLINGSAWGLRAVFVPGVSWFIWFPPVLALWYLWGMRKFGCVC